jgi:hypothetical protein
MLLSVYDNKKVQNRNVGKNRHCTAAYKGETALSIKMAPTQ